MNEKYVEVPDERHNSKSGSCVMGEGYRRHGSTCESGDMACYAITFAVVMWVWWGLYKLFVGTAPLRGKR